MAPQSSDVDVGVPGQGQCGEPLAVHETSLPRLMASGMGWSLLEVADAPGEDQLC